MNKKILVSLSIIGIVAAMAIGATTAYFSDTETSEGNTFTAGSIDLKIDLQCSGPGCSSFSLRDLNGEDFFDENDVKPGDSGEVTVSFHVYDNNAWGRIKLADVYNYENGCTESEADEDGSCGDPGLGEGELDEYLLFTIWLDEGQVPGWQCTETNGPCDEDLKEGNNVLDSEEGNLVFENDEALIRDLLENPGSWIPFPEEIQASQTYYVGIMWRIPPETGNIIQTDSIIGSIVMEVVQSRNNPNPWE